MRTIAITSGKGGVGKTNIVANMAYALSGMGQRVMIFDADLGLGNIDVLLGLSPKYNLEHVIYGEKRIEEILVEGPGGVKIIPASSGVEELTSLSEDQRRGLISQFETLTQGADILLIDTAPGISSNVIFFNLAASQIIVVVSPEPSSLVDAYALIKVLSRHDAKRRFQLLVNNVSDGQEADRIFERFDMVTSRFLGVSLEYLGYIFNDRNVTKAVRAKRVLMELYPFSKASICFCRLAKRICERSVPILQGDSLQYLFVPQTRRFQ